MSGLAGFGTLGVALVLTVLLFLGTGKNAGQGRRPKLEWMPVVILSFLNGAALAMAGDPLKFNGLVTSCADMISKGGQGTVTVTGFSALLIVIVLWAKMQTRTTFILVVLAWFSFNAAGGTPAALAGFAENIANSFA